MRRLVDDDLVDAFMLVVGGVALVVACDCSSVVGESDIPFSEGAVQERGRGRDASQGGRDGGEGQVQAEGDSTYSCYIIALIQYILSFSFCRSRVYHVRVQITMILQRQNSTNRINQSVR